MDARVTLAEVPKGGNPTVVPDLRAVRFAYGGPSTVLGV